MQVVTDASTDYVTSSTDPTRNRRVTGFDFNAIAAAFDAARMANPTLTRWTVASALAGALVSGSDPLHSEATSPTNMVTAEAWPELASTPQEPS
jgi:hypothetical protein